MAGAFAAEHADMYAEVAANGAAVTFTKTTPGAFNESTGVTADPTVSSVAGVAMKVKGDKKRYESLSLIESNAPTLLFVPATYGDEPDLGAIGEWAGDPVTLKDVETFAPDGTAISARCVVVS